ncbi:MAG: signal peptidase I [Verrucomicrobia bacterium]|nr:signal peptidase I [Verrucomicrobiota bacterium]
MNPFLTDGYLVYRRWVNVIPSVLIPGSCQFLTGRKRAGVLLFLTAYLFGAIGYCLAVAPICKSIIPAAVAAGLLCCTQIFAIINGCLIPLPRLNWKKWVIILLLASAMSFVCAFCLRQFVGRSFTAPSKAMEPTLAGEHKTNDGETQKGDRFTVDMRAYRSENPKRGDVVVFSTRGISSQWIRGESLFVKRVVGIPGDKVSINPPFILINGSKLTEPKVFSKIAASSNGYAGYSNMGLMARVDDAIALGENEYFVLGDNSPNSLDGRFFGAIKRGDVLGKVVWIYWPPDRRGMPE